ncbi:MAG: Macrolide export protein MacA [Pseudomonadota bacterium]|jgi:RND family efflux transporter MFP subunit
MKFSPKPKHLSWIALGLLALAIAAGVGRAVVKRNTQQSQATQAAQLLQTTPVYELVPSDWMTAKNVALTQTVAVSGSIKALQSAVVKARVAGELQGLNKREGQSVSEGEVVARVVSPDAGARVRQAEQQAQAAKAQADIAQRTHDNNLALVAQGFISNTALQNSLSQLASAQANHRAALAALDIARQSLNDTALRAPLSGQISARLAQNGERVAVEARVVEIVDLSAFELEAALSPVDAARVQTGQSVELRVEGRTEVIAATVNRINPSVQAGSRSVLVYLRIPNASGLRQGLFAQGHIVTGEASAMAVPASAVRNDKPAPYIQIVQDGQVRHWPAQITAQGQFQGEPMIGIRDLPDGTPVLRAQTGLIREGTAVTLRTTP